ncbi:carcinoembryonic antigen-related cell adhesion molecule 5-like [Labrus bergylta]|uniref:carcinoembryonic antigen-related cell adhesion molecule 5-like n=1 Tax=Labrus bergylta TaxID=56723 RepID=UPI0033132CA5
MSLTAAASGFVVFLLSVPVIQGQAGWGVTYSSTEVCALRGSTVVLRCTYSYPSTTTVQKSFWFTKVQDGEPVDLQTDSQYTGRVTYSSKSKDCTLTITNVGNSDSAVYKFRFITNHQDGSYTGDPGVTLSLTDPDLHVGTSRYSSFWADLTCVSSCTLPPHSSYIWFKNGEKIPRKTSSTYSDYFNNADSYSCALQGHQDFPSPPVCVRGETCNRVKYDVRTICAPKGSSVDIYCTYNGHEAVTSKFWFSPEHSQHWYQSNRVQVSERERGRSTLRISDLRESDSAQHRFKFTTRSFEWRSSLPGTTLTVTALQVQVKRIRADQHSIEVEMTCHSSCSEVGRLSYVWFRNKQKITRAVTSTYKGWFYLEDEISCALNGHDRFPSPSVYVPKFPSVSVSPSAEIVENSTVTLTCSSDANPAANYTWYKKNGNPDFQPLSKGPELVFSSVQSSDSGEFYCAAENDLGRRTSEHFISDVKYAPKLPSVSVSPSAEIVEGSSVTLTCSSDANPAANYTWFKENNNQPLSREAQLIFSSIKSSDSGEFSCKAENDLGKPTYKWISIDVKFSPKLPSVSVSPSAEIVEGSSVTLTCSSDANPAANYTWFKEDEDSPTASGQIFTISNFSADHSGRYYCEAQNTRGRHNSTLHLLVVAGNSTFIIHIIKWTLLLLMLISLLLVTLWMRKKKTLSSTTEPAEVIEVDVVYENVSAVTAAQTEDTKEQEHML